MRIKRNIFVFHVLLVLQLVKIIFPNFLRIHYAMKVFHTIIRIIISEKNSSYILNLSNFNLMNLKLLKNAEKFLIVTKTLENIEGQTLKNFLNKNIIFSLYMKMTSKFILKSVHPSTNSQLPLIMINKILMQLTQPKSSIQLIFTFLFHK